MTQVHRQYLRGAKTALDSMIGLPGQIIIETPSYQPRVYDGVLAGGHRIPTEDDFIGVSGISVDNQLGAGNGIRISGAGLVPTSFPLTTGVGLTLVGGLGQASAEISMGTPTGLTSTSVNSAVGTTHSHSIDSTIARSAVLITAGSGLTGGGDLTASRTITLGLPESTSATSINAVGVGTHSHEADVSLARAAVFITAGNGLFGGGDLTGNFTIELGTPGTLSSTSTSAVTATSHTHVIDSTIARSAVTVTAGSGLTGGGSLAANFDIVMGLPGDLGAGSTSIAAGPTHFHAIDSTIARSSVNMIAGNGLTGGGTLTGNRTFTLGTPGSLTATSTNAVTTTSHTHAFDPNIFTKLYSAAFAIGCLIMAKRVAPAATAFGATVVGNNLLQLSDADNFAGALVGVTATWTCLGQTGATSTAVLWLRTA